MNVKFLKMYPGVKTPTYATPGAACFDISAYSNIFSHTHIDSYESRVIDTGLQFEVPEGFVMLIFSRSGHGFKNNVRLANCVGVIDSDYRGELKVKLTNDGEEDFLVSQGDRIAQGMLIPVSQVNFELVESLSETGRGAGGFGSTGS